MRKLLILLGLIFLVACSNEDTKITDLSENGKIAKQYVESLGYEVVSLEEEDIIRFTKEDMILPPNKQFWSVQTIEPTPYLNKDLVRIKLLVKNHPFSNMYESEKTKVAVIIWNTEVIGGTSFPYSKKPLLGGRSSIDGKSAEEVKENYIQWSENWDELYQ